jgi:serine O-acetyltransferase
MSTDPTTRSFSEWLAADDRRVPPLPLRRDVSTFIDDLLGILFLQLAGEAAPGADEIERRLDASERALGDAIAPVVPEQQCGPIARAFFGALPELRRRIVLDAEAIVAGDPAATGIDEVIGAYPGFLAIAVHRLAHELRRLDVPIVPRILSEVAHARTGVDIHPGATIGASFCIDHGTGVVVGESTVIGDNVKLYQGVTLGALSVEKTLAGTKRHPTIGDRVVIYANATVLGGETTIGHDSVIGGNVFLTTSVPPHSVVYHTSQIRVRSAAETLEPLDFVI